MHKIKLIFLFIFTCSTVVSMEKTVKQPHLVTWLDNDTIFVGKEKEFTITNTRTKAEKKGVCALPRGQIHDIAVNKTNTQYAISFSEKIECYDTAGHKHLWKKQHHEKTYVPITFNSQDENQVIYGMKSTLPNHNTCLFPAQNIPHLQCFYTTDQELSPISCGPAQTTILFRGNNSTGHAIRIVNDHLSVLCDVTDADCSSIIGTQCTSDEKYIVVNFGNKLKIYTGHIFIEHVNTILMTQSPCIAFECYNNTILAALTQNNKLYYYNYPTKQLLAQIDMLESLVQEKCKNTGKYLSFSPDGKNLLVATQNGYSIIPVSLDVRYWKGMEKLSAIFYLLRPYLTYKS